MYTSFGAEIPEEQRAKVVQSQIEFRRSRRHMLAKRASEKRLPSVKDAQEREDIESQAMLEQSAAVLVQSCTRVLHTHLSSGGPSFEKPSYVIPNAAQREERLRNLLDRFQDVPLDEVAHALERCRYHGGHAAQLLSHRDQWALIGMSMPAKHDLQQFE